MIDMTDDGVPLSHYLSDHPDTAVRFGCTACQRSQDLDLPLVLARLKARRIGDERTGIRALARLADRPCPRCGAMRWETRPAMGIMRTKPRSTPQP
jgi:hypothetical protein